MLLTPSERKAQNKHRLQAVRNSTRIALARSQSIRTEFLEHYGRSHSRLQDRLKKQRKDRYIGRGTALAYEREYWMDKIRSAHVQLLEKSASATLSLMRYAVKTPRPKTHKKTYSMTYHRGLTFDDQKGICHFCNREISFDKWTIDHLLPLSRGGGNEHQNLKGACSTCNNAKGALTEEEFKDAGYVQNLQRHGAAMEAKRNRFISVCRNIIQKTKYQSTLPNRVIDMRP